MTPMFGRLLRLALISFLPVTVHAQAVTGATADATVKSTELVQVLSVDGLEQPGALFGSRRMALPLSPGEHVISVRYNQLFQLGADDHDIVKSPPVAFRFTAEPGKLYEFRINPPKRYDDARKFAANPDIQLVDTVSGEARSGILIKSLGQASLVDTMGKAFQSAMDNTENSASNGTLENLKALWMNATPAERQAFAAWLAAQASQR